MPLPMFSSPATKKAARPCVGICTSKASKLMPGAWRAGGGLMCRRYDVFLRGREIASKATRRTCMQACMHADRQTARPRGKRKAKKSAHSVHQFFVHCRVLRKLCKVPGKNNILAARRPHLCATVVGEGGRLAKNSRDKNI